MNFPILRHIYAPVQECEPVRYGLSRLSVFILIIWWSNTPGMRSLYRKMREIGITEEERQERGLSFHSWRHFFNTRLIASGVQRAVTRAVVGHESEKMTEHYLHLQPSDMETVMKVQGEIGGRTLYFSSS
ncbi:tyrosine-type recombinase/integrase [Parasphaerochaeta coccoides]|nr:tyrosine-type recombinase/integrase [Parasphaerochaeta coccoides]